MSSSRKYWNSLEQYNNDPEFIAKAQNEFQTDIPVAEFLGKEELNETSTSRRDFLKFVGFSVAAATLAACEAPVVKSIPYVVQPDEIVPGIANYYASTYFDGFDFASVLVKTREGRPIYIEPNKLSGLNVGVSARVSASVLSLYDSSRASKSTLNGNDISWKELDQKVIKTLKEAKTVRVLTSSLASPSTKSAVQKLADSIGESEFVHVIYDAYSASAIRKANELSFGKKCVPDYRFNESKTIVSIGADFLSTWLSSLEYAAQYTSRRNPDNDWMNKHYHFEGNMSLTGSNADIRAAVKPSEYGAIAIALHNEVATLKGASKLASVSYDDDNAVASKLKEAAKDLVSANGKGLVVCGSNDTSVQIIINSINSMLGAYGNTIDLNTALKTREGDDEAFVSLVKEMNAGSVDVLIINGVNPLYSTPKSLGFETALSKVKTSIYIGDRHDETSKACSIFALGTHYLESWNDHKPKSGIYTITQPTIRPLFASSRQFQDSLLKWAGEETSYYDFIRNNWKEGNFNKQSKYTDFETFWNSTVHDGVAKNSTEVSEQPNFNFDLNVAAKAISNHTKPSGLDVEFYIETAIGLGNQANNPWLHELPHAITKVTWDNYIAMNPSDMIDANGKEIYNIKIAEQTPASVAKLTVNGFSVELPVIPLPGQRKGCVSVALGYGRTNAGKVVELGDSEVNGQKSIGQNLYGALGIVDNNIQYQLTGAIVEPTGNTYPIGWTQTHHTMMGRKIVNETSLKTFKAHSKDTWNPDHVIADAYGRPTNIKKLDMWSVHDIALGHRWGMSIDLNSCIGCGACVTACHSENNVPVVGKDEVRRTRTMSWMRIDRYYTSDMSKPIGKEQGIGKIDMYAKMEIPSDYPEVVHQPIMCQHCNHAPCETVCPVAATTHSNEGLNQMTYNRCIGTRYCANNCPYKVRRFNWFNYIGDHKFTGINPSQDDLGRMVLNPDVVVRSRGVMEKCSFCVQRIQGGKLAAKKAGRPVKDGDVTSACSNACPTNAISFGDLNDETTVVAKNTKTDRAYNLIEEVGTQPNVWYLTKVRNLNEERVHEAVAGHGSHAHADHNHEEHTH